MKINLIPDTSVSSAPAGFTAAVQAAAEIYDQDFPGNYTVNITYGWGTYDNEPNSDLTSTSSGIASLGGAAYNYVSYATVKNWLIANATLSDQIAAVASLPADDTAFPGDANTFAVSYAQQIAFGAFTGSSGAIDGSIGFNDTDPSKRNFEGLALGEIGHALGWSTDHYVGAPTILDLFRYSSLGTYEWTGGLPAYFSTNDGTTDLANFATSFDFTLLNSQPNDPFSPPITSSTVDLTSLDIEILNAVGFGAFVPTPLTVESLSHAQTNNATDLKAGVTVTITLTMSEQNLKVTGTPGLTLSDSGVASYSASASNLTNGILVFTYTVAAGQDAADLQVTGTTFGPWSVTDQSGNVADLSGAAQHLGLVVDTQVPAITGVSAHVTGGPTANAGYAVADDNIEIDIQFSDGSLTITGTPLLKVGSLAATCVSTLTDLTEGILAFDNTVANYQRLTALKIGALTLPKGDAITDAAGNLANIKLSSSDKSLGITADGMPPTVKSTKAKSTAKTIVTGSIITITLTMSENVTVNGTPSLILSDGGVANYASGSGGKTLLFTYTVGAGQISTDLTISGIQSATAITDIAGNQLSSTYNANLRLKINDPPVAASNINNLRDPHGAGLGPFVSAIAGLAPTPGYHETKLAATLSEVHPLLLAKFHA